MIRGTTRTVSFTLPFEADRLAEAWITLSQQGKVVLNKELRDCTREGKTISVLLTQDETLLLQEGSSTEIQLRVRTVEGNAMASRIPSVATGRILKDGVI